MKKLIFAGLVLALIACRVRPADPEKTVVACEAGTNTAHPCKPSENTGSLVHYHSSAGTVSGTTIRERFNPPEGFVRNPVCPGGYQEYLRNLSLKPHGSKVLLYNGQEKARMDVAAAVVDRPIGKKDLHQCADAILGLRADYFYRKKEYDRIGFHFTNGQLFEYKTFAMGYRPVFKANRFIWEKTAGENFGPDSFGKYLEILFTYAGTLSLCSELLQVDGQLPEIGDVYILGGSPGHAVLVVDMASHPETGETLMLLAQSYMPAQEMHVLNNLNEPGLSPWYRVDPEKTLNTPEWDFLPGCLKRFF